MSVRAIAAIFAATLSFTPYTFAETVTVGSLTLTDPWARATPPNAPTAGGYLTITNSGAEPERLIAVTSPVAGKAEIHMMEVKDGVMSMHEVGGGLAIPPGGSVTLAPGGLRLMFIGLQQPFKEGDAVPVTLTFEGVGSVDAVLSVQPIGAKGPAGAADHDMSNMQMDSGQ
jgi:copper(I)-binding protein